MDTFSHGLLDLRNEFILTAVPMPEARSTSRGKLKEGRLLTISEYNLALYRDLKNLKLEDESTFSEREYQMTNGIIR